MNPVHIQRRKPINRKTKLNIVFDENARRSFLTGFRKRKLQRQKKAQDDLKQKLKEERKRIKLEAQKSYEKLKLSYQPIPEVEELLRTSGTNYDYGDHSVSVVEINNDFLQKKSNYIGENKVLYEENETEDEKIKHNDSEDEVTGMELKTRKEIKKEMKKKATAEIKKSKVYQLKNKIEQQKQKKKSSLERKRKIKMEMKNKKGKKKEMKNKKGKKKKNNFNS